MIVALAVPAVMPGDGFMITINAMMNWIGGLFFGTMRTAGPWTAMIAVSFASAVIVMVVFRLVSNRDRIRRRKGLMISRLLELLLFRHDIALSSGAFVRLLGANVAYLSAFLVPLAVCMVPLVLIMVQTGAWLDARPLGPGEQGLLKARFVKGSPVMMQTVSAEGSGALKVDAAAVRIPERNEICWALYGAAAGDAKVTVTVGGNACEKLVSCGPGMRRVSQKRVAGGVWAQTLNPFESPLPSACLIETISVEYPRSWLSTDVPGVRWLVVYTLLTLLFGWLLQKPFDVVV